MNRRLQDREEPIFENAQARFLLVTRREGKKKLVAELREISLSGGHTVGSIDTRITCQHPPRMGQAALDLLARVSRERARAIVEQRLALRNLPPPPPKSLFQP